MDLTVEECSNLPRFLPLSPETQRKGRSLGGKYLPLPLYRSCAQPRVTESGWAHQKLNLEPMHCELQTALLHPLRGR